MYLKSVAYIIAMIEKTHIGSFSKLFGGVKINSNVFAQDF